MLISMATSASKRSLLILALLASASVSAQTVATETQNFSVERLRISTNRLGLIDVESGALEPHLSFDVGLWVGYAKNPLVVNSITDNNRLGSLVRDRFGANLFGSIGLFDWVEIGLAVPLILYQSRPGEIPGALATDTVLSQLSRTKLGDLRAQVKIRLLNQKDFGVSLALMPAATFPTGGAQGYAGEPRVVWAPEALLSRDFDHLRLGLNLGGVIRRRTVLLNETVESELTGHLGAGWRFKAPQDKDGIPLEIDASLSAAVSAYRPFRQSNQNHLELRAMLAYDVIEAIQVFAGGGIGLLPGWGTPDWRVFMGMRFGTVPEKPPVMLAAKEDPDPDHDGVLGAADRCPNAPGPNSNDGCPDLDVDGDKIVDRKDKCPQDAEDVDQFQDEDGCPDPDNDEDGVLDVNDQCPLEKGPEANRGCPDPDRDGDSVVDRLDNCPDEPGPVENQGCAKRQLVIISEGGLRILENVYFKTNRDVIEVRSFAVLDNVVSVLKAHPEVKHVLVEGHTDSVGKPVKNMDLSDRRARSVMRYLVSHGIEPERLTAKGYGQTKPVADNKTAAGREKNRRVVFTILDDNQETP
ncbi:MAG: OmpA family protein [Myxococcaceae bacterium]